MTRRHLAPVLLTIAALCALVPGAAQAATPGLLFFSPTTSDYASGPGTLFNGPKISLTEPVTTPTMVTIDNSAPAVVTTGDVTFMPGSSEGYVRMECAGVGSATLTATLETDHLAATVRCLAPGSPVVVLAADSHVEARGTQITIAAHMYGSPGIVDPKYRVTVTGANPFTQTKTVTGIDPDFPITYTGVNAGDDHVHVCLLDLADACTTSAEIIVRWVPAQMSHDSALAFGELPKGTTSEMKLLTVSNPGTVPTKLGLVTIGGEAGGDYAIVADSCSLGTLFPGISCVVGVRFTPSDAGARPATLTIPTNAPAPAGSVILTGSGQSPPGSGAPSTGDPSTNLAPSVVAKPSPFTATGKRHRRSGGLAVSARLPGAGRVTALAAMGSKTVGSVSGRRTSAGALALVLKPNAKGRKLLRKRKSIRLKVSVTFMPASGGAPQLVKLTATFVRGKR